MNELSRTIKGLKSKGKYETKTRFRQELDEVGRGFVNGIAQQFGGFDERIKTIYIGEESTPDNPIEKLPNMTLFWNLLFANRGFMYASSMGHLHPHYETMTQEVYEFHGYGGIVLHDKGSTGVTFYVCKPGDKVPVPPDCIMTIFNLSHQRLLTLDMANPLRNSSSKDIIKSSDGPMIAIYNLGDSTETEECDFSDYQAQINIGGTVRIALNPNYPVFGINKTAVLELKVEPNESGLYDALLNAEKEFRKYYIGVIPSTPECPCSGSKAIIYRLNKGLIDLVLDSEKPVHRLLDMV